MGNKPKQWVHWLRSAKWNYNASYHTSSKFFPFELVYGYAPPHVSAYELGTAKVESVGQALIAQDHLLSMLKTNLEVAQNRMRD